MGSQEERDHLKKIIEALEKNEKEKAIQLARSRLESKGSLNNEEGTAEIGVVQVPSSSTQVRTAIMENLKGFTISATASAFGATAVYPIDLVKTRMQNQRGSSQLDKKYKNSIDCFMKVLRNEGFLKLYKGLVPNLIGQVPEKAMRLFVVDTVRTSVINFYKPTNQNQSTAKPPSKAVKYMAEIIAGTSAGACQVLITNPAEIVKVRLQVAGEAKSSKGIMGILQDLGLKGMYRGASACFLRDIPFSMIYFPMYALGKDILTDKSTKYIGPFELLLAGSFAGMCAASVTTPADVIKTRLQVETPPGQVPYKGLIDCFTRIIQNEGPKALLKGIGPRIVRSSPQYGMMLLAYELLLQLFPSESTIKEHVSPLQVDQLMGGGVEDKWMTMRKWVPPAHFNEVTDHFRTISVGGQGAVWGITHDNKVWTWNGFSWHQINGVSLTSISVGADGAACGVNSNGDVVVWDPWNVRFRTLPDAPKLKRVSVGNATKIWGLGVDNTVYKYRGGSRWKPRGTTKMQSVSVGADGTVWALDQEGNPHRWVSDVNSWLRIDAPVKLRQITVGGAKSVWGVDHSAQLYKWTGTQWQATELKFGHVSAAADGTVLGILNSEGVKLKVEGLSKDK